MAFSDLHNSECGRVRAGVHRASGFTLLELLVAVTLLSVVLLLALNGLRFGSRSWEVQQTRAERHAAVRIARDYLQRQLQQAVPHSIGEGTETRLVFDGEQDRLRFVATMRRGPREGARYLFTLTPLADASRTQLVLDYALLDPSTDRLRTLPAQRVVLMDDVKAFEFAYFGRGKPRQRPRWRVDWPADADRLPRLVRLRIALAEQEEPMELSIALPLHDAALERRRES